DPLDAGLAQARGDVREMAPVADHPGGEVGHDPKPAVHKSLRERDRRLEALGGRGRDGNARAPRQVLELIVDTLERQELECGIGQDPGDGRPAGRVEARIPKGPAGHGSQTFESGEAAFWRAMKSSS